MEEDYQERISAGCVVLGSAVRDYATDGERDIELTRPKGSAVTYVMRTLRKGRPAAELDPTTLFRFASLRGLEALITRAIKGDKFAEPESRLKRPRTVRIVRGRKNVFGVYVID